MAKLDDFQVSEIVERYLAGESASSLARAFSVNHETICNRLNKSGVKLRTHQESSDLFKKLTKEQIIEMVSLYQEGSTPLQLAKRYGVGRRTISFNLRKEKIELRSKSEGRRKHTLNESVFDTITEESAYWIGFLMADGSVHHPPRASPRIKLELQKRDSEHVRHFKNFLNSSHLIYRSRENVAISFSSSKIAESLAKYGVTPRKSFTAKVIGLENNRHFWRGMIDGDGCISDISKGRPKSVGLVGSKASMEQFALFVGAITNLPKPKVRRRENIYTVNLYHLRAEKIISLLYEDCTISLSRKLARAERIINNNKTSRKAHISSAELGY